MPLNITIDNPRSSRGSFSRQSEPNNNSDTSLSSDQADRPASKNDNRANEGHQFFLGRDQRSGDESISKSSTDTEDEGWQSSGLGQDDIVPSDSCSRSHSHGQIEVSSSDTETDQPTLHRGLPSPSRPARDAPQPAMFLKRVRVSSDDAPARIVDYHGRARQSAREGWRQRELEAEDYFRRREAEERRGLSHRTQDTEESYRIEDRVDPRPPPPRGAPPPRRSPPPHDNSIHRQHHRRYGELNRARSFSRPSRRKGPAFVTPEEGSTGIGMNKTQRNRSWSPRRSRRSRFGLPRGPESPLSADQSDLEDPFDDYPIYDSNEIHHDPGLPPNPFYPTRPISTGPVPYSRAYGPPPYGPIAYGPPPTGYHPSAPPPGGYDPTHPLPNIHQPLTVHPPPPFPPMNPIPLGSTPGTNTGAHYSNTRQSLITRPTRGLQSIASNDPYFKEDFGLFSNPDSPESKVTCKMTITNNFEKFVSSELDEGASIWDLVILSGDVYDERLWATTCGEYVSTRWPRSSKNIKNMFHFICDTTESRKSMLSLTGHKNESAVAISRGPANREASYDLFGTIDDQVDLVQAMTWLSAVTVNGESGPVATGARLYRENHFSRSGNNFFIRNDIYEPLLPNEAQLPGTCWKPLFPRTASAIDFPGRPRPPGMHGVEISFELMCLICGLEYAVIEDEGVILYGQRSCVYPVHYDELVSGCVQWHFKERDVSRAITPDKERSRVVVNDLDQLFQAQRHFLGLWKDPEISLGTEKSTNFEDLWWSSAEELKKTQVLSSRTVGGALALPKVLTFTYQQTYKIGKSRRNIFMRDFEGYLDQKINSPVLLYSPSEKRAWLVSFLSVLLHLVRARAHFQSYLGRHVPACEVSSNGGQAAFDCLYSCYRKPLKQVKENEILSEDEQNYTIEGYVSEVKAIMDSMMDESFKARGNFRSQIVGFELADIARKKSSMTMKRHKLPSRATGWSPILDKVELTLFYEGLHDPITYRDSPNPSIHASSQCALTTWKTIPRGSDLLTASLPCLVSLTNSHNPPGSLQYLTSDYRWHSPMSENILDECSRKRKHVCNRLQEFRVVRRGTEASSPKIDYALAESKGAVVFRYKDGVDEIQKRLEALPKVPSLSTPTPFPLRTVRNGTSPQSSNNHVNSSSPSSVTTDIAPESSREFSSQDDTIVNSLNIELSSSQESSQSQSRALHPSSENARPVPSPIIEDTTPAAREKGNASADEERTRRHRRRRHRQPTPHASIENQSKTSQKRTSTTKPTSKESLQPSLKSTVKNPTSERSPPRNSRRKQGKGSELFSRFLDRYLSD